MSRELSDLTPSFRKEISTLLEACKDAGIEMRPYFTLRTPEQQAKLWRQSRSTQEIEDGIALLEDNGAPFLAKTLRDVGPQQGEPVTRALPGASWHQWGEACDCYWLLDGKAIWSAVKKIEFPDGTNHNGYRLYAERAKAQGFTPGGYWASPKDWPHVQQSAESSPLKLYSWSEIDEAMKQKWS